MQRISIFFLLRPLSNFSLILISFCTIGTYVKVSHRITKKSIIVLSLIKCPIYFNSKISMTGSIVCGMFIRLGLPAIKQIMYEKVGIQDFRIHFTLFL